MFLVGIFALLALTLAFACNIFATMPSRLPATKYILAPVYGIASLGASFFVVLSWIAMKGASTLETIHRLQPRHYAFTFAVFAVEMLLARFATPGVGHGRNNE